ncbi:retrovirus-related Pol polyprotein from transposon opus [Trichonephila clavipes]|nr:retrovirus-related Pol polyprotein from transposon opus [Trichonephila clavipes]
MAFLIRSKKIDLIQLARDLDESPDPSMSKIVLRDLIISSKYYKEEEAKELLEVITAERLETEQQQKLEQQEQLSIEKLRLEVELSRNANQSATQNNGQTSRVKSLDEIVKMVRLLTVKVPNKSDGWDYFFSSLEKAFTSENVSDELKPKVLLCMLGDKVSSLLVNLGEEELKDYESLKQVVLKEYGPSPKICLENFRKAKRNSDETFSQFASRLTSMWLYYCKLRGANDFESVNQLIVADKMFEMLGSETATHIGVLQGEEWYKPRDLDKQCDIFYASKGKSYDEPERAKWNDSEKRSFNGSWVIPRRAIEDKLCKLVKTSISVDGKLVQALVDSGTEITVIKKDLVPAIPVEGASTIYLKGIFGSAVKCPLVYVPIGLATGGQVNVVHQQVLCALAEVLVEDVLLPPDVLDMLGGAQSEENSLAKSSQNLRVDSGNVDETEVSLGILPEKAQEHIEDSQRNITSCRNAMGALGTKDEVTAEMDKGSMVADSFRSEQECGAELALAWKYAKEGKGNYYEVDGYLFRRDKILGESIGQLVIPKCRRTEVLRLAHIFVFSSHMGPKKTLERIKYSFFWEGLRANVKKFCESCKECQLTRSVRIKDRSPITPVARPELPFQVVNMDLIGPIDPPGSKRHKYILCLVDQHIRWGEAVPLTSLSAKETCEALLNIFSRTEIYLLLKREGFLGMNSAASWVTVLDLWSWYFCRSLTKNPRLLLEQSSVWSQWWLELPFLSELKIPRKILDSSGDSSEVQIHTFSDANQRAYGAAAFLRVKHKDRVSVDLVTSKSRVASLKRLSLPRLELMGALLAARLAKEVKKILDQKVREIQSLTDPNSWFHCSGKDNPADLLTRGISVDALTTNSKWWNGSSFLCQIDFQTKGLDEAIPERVYLTEMRKNSNPKEDISLTLTVTKNNFLENIIDISNNYVKLIRVEVSHADNWLIHSLHDREFYEEMRKLLAGTLVLIKDENLPSIKWSTGRITEIFPGTDGGACKDLLPEPGNSRTRHEIERRIWQRGLRRKGTREKGKWWREKTWSDKGKKKKDCGTMFCNLGSSEYILFLMKCPMEDVQ